MSDKYCLGLGCKYYPAGKDGGLCFHAGFLPKCSPELKAERKKIDFASLDLYEASKEVVKAYKCSPTSMQPLFWLRCLQALSKAEEK